MDQGMICQFSRVFLVFFLGLFVYLLVDSSGLTVYSQDHYSFTFKWGSKGEGNSQFERPHDIEFDSSGNAYVTDRDLHNVQKFTHDGDFIKKWGSKGTEDGQFRQPYSISIDPSDHIYVVDKNNHRIQIFDVEGNFLDKIDSAIGSSNTSFNNPEDMARDPSTGDIYLTDTYNNRIVRLDRNFNFILEWGRLGEGPGEFDHPHGIGVDSLGNVYINDLNSPRIQKFDNKGNFIKQWGTDGTGPGELTPPLEHLFVDESDYVWIVDGEANPRIQKFDTSGNFVTSVGSGPCIIDEEVKKDPVKMTEPLSCDGDLHQPEHAFLDTEGNLYIIDRGNQRIVVYSPN